MKSTLSIKKINNLKIKEIPHESSKHKKAGVAILTLNKADFNVEKMDEEEYLK